MLLLDAYSKAHRQKPGVIMAGAAEIRYEIVKGRNEGTYRDTAPVSPRCPSPIPVEPEIGVLLG